MIDGRTTLPTPGIYLVHFVDSRVNNGQPCLEGIVSIQQVRPAQSAYDIPTVVFSSKGTFGVSNTVCGWYRTFTPFHVDSPGRFL
jgi:hypothetical protein